MLIGIYLRHGICGRRIRGIALEGKRRGARMFKLGVVLGGLKYLLISSCIYSKAQVTYLDDVGILGRLDLSTVIAEL